MEEGWLNLLVPGRRRIEERTGRAIQSEGSAFAKSWSCERLPCTKHPEKFHCIRVGLEGAWYEVARAEALQSPRGMSDTNSNNISD